MVTTLLMSRLACCVGIQHAATSCILLSSIIIFLYLSLQVSSQDMLYADVYQSRKYGTLSIVLVL